MVTNQAYLFLIFTFNGILIGLLFDFFRILRKSFKTADLITYIQDTLFWILTGIIILYSIFAFNNGEIRLFMFLGILIGVTLYVLLLSQMFIKINVSIIQFLKKIIGTIIKIVIYPFKMIYQILYKIFYRPINRLFCFLTQKSTKIITKMKNNIQISKKMKNNVKNYK